MASQGNTTIHHNSTSYAISSPTMLSNNISSNDSDYNGSYSDYYDDSNWTTLYDDGGDIDTEMYYFNVTERILSAGGVLLNIATIIILLSLNGSLKTQLKLIMSLAISDCLIALSHFLLTFYKLPNIWKIYRDMYSMGLVEYDIPETVFSFLYTTTQYAGLGTMFAISIDVFIKVKNPFHYSTLMSKKRGNIIVACLWIVPSLIFVAIGLIFSVRLDYLDIQSVFLNVSIIYYLVCVLFFFIFLIIYTIILYLIRSFINRLPSCYRHSISKTAVTFFLIIATYFVCILPTIWLFLPVYFETASLTAAVLTFSIGSCLYTLNTVLDPLIYATRIPEIRTKYETLFRRMCLCLRPESGSRNMETYQTETT